MRTQPKEHQIAAARLPERCILVIININTQPLFIASVCGGGPDLRGWEKYFYGVPARMHALFVVFSPRLYLALAFFM
jgi:hypothetical protein